MLEQIPRKTLGQLADTVSLELYNFISNVHVDLLFEHDISRKIETGPSAL